MGIGTANPSYGQLTLYKDGANDTKLALANNGNGGGTVAWTLKNDTAYDLTLSHNAGIGGQNLIFGTKTSGGESMRIDSSGNVGIGRSSTLRQKLHIQDSSAGIELLSDTTGQSLIHFGDTSNFDTGAIVYDHPTDSFRFDTADTERMRIDSSGNVGIGNSNPSYPLEVGDALGIYDDNTSAVVAANTGHDLELRARSSQNVRIVSGGTEAMRIDSSGNLLVGTTDNQPWDNSGTSTGAVLRSDGLISSATNGQSAIELNRLSSDGNIANFRRSGTLVGSIGNSGNYMYLASQGSGSRGVKITDNFIPATITGANNDNAMDLGGASVRWDDVYATNGTIQTSDRNEKQDIAELTDAEQRVAVAAKGLLRKFRWRDSVEALSLIHISEPTRPY